jgi:hypothetical protein
VTSPPGRDAPEVAASPGDVEGPVAEVLVFPDTNVLLHGKGLEELPVPAIVKAGGKVTVVLTRTVLAELDGQKTKNPNKGLRERAGKRSRALWNLYRNDDRALSANVSVEFEMKAPDGDLAALGLDATVGDDRILAEVLAVKSRSGERRVILLSRDAGMLIKAAELGLESIELDDEHVLPVPDEQSSKLQALQRENEKLRSRVPKLSVSFEDGRSFLETSVVRPRQLSEPEIRARCEEAARSIPVMAPPVPTAMERMLGTSLPGLPGALGQPSDSAIREFNRQREAWLDKLADYFRTDWLDDELLAARTVVLSTALDNSGTCPATDVQVELRFGRGVILEEGTLPTRRAPRPPAVPRGLLDMGSPLGGGGHLDALIGGIGRPRNVTGPWVDNGGESPSVEWHVTKIRHGESLRLPPFVMLLPGLEDLNVGGAVRNGAEELHEPRETRLGIKVAFRDP